MSSDHEEAVIKTAKTQLRKDKHSVLEGYVTELLFKKQFLSEGLLYTHGWWTGVRKGKKYIFIIKDKLNKLDNELIRRLSNDYEIWQVHIDYNNKENRYHANFIKNNKYYSFEEFKALLSIDHKSKYEFCAKESERDKFRQNKCIYFFSENRRIM